MPLEKPIALGRTAEIYAWEDGYVVKLFRDGMPAASVEYEARIARTVHAAGLPVPAVGEVVDINGRFGLVFASRSHAPAWERKFDAQRLQTKAQRVIVQSIARKIWEDRGAEKASVFRCKSCGVWCFYWAAQLRRPLSPQPLGISSRRSFREQLSKREHSERNTR